MSLDNTGAAPLDQEPNSHEEYESRQARLDRVINSRGSRYNAAAGTPVAVSPDTAGRTNLSYNTATGLFTNRDTGETFTEAEVTAAAQSDTARIPDDGRNLDHEIELLGREYKRLQALLDEATFDPHTGAKQFALQGAPRAQVEAALTAHLQTCEYQADLYTRLQAQRDADAAAEEQAAIDEAALDETIRRMAQQRALELKVEQEAQRIIAEEERRRRAKW